MWRPLVIWQEQLHHPTAGAMAVKTWLEYVRNNGRSIWKGLTSSVFYNMQINTIMSDQYIPAGWIKLKGWQSSVGVCMEICVVGRYANWYKRFGKLTGSILWAKHDIMTQQFHYWLHAQQDECLCAREHTEGCSQQLHSREENSGNNPNVHRQNGQSVVRLYNGT